MPVFYDWFERPAFVPDYGRHGFAITAPHGPWIIVPLEQLEGAQVLESQVAWRERFEPNFGYLDGRKIPRTRLLTVGALVHGRAQQALGEEYNDPDLSARGQVLEERALAALHENRRTLPDLN